MAKRPDWAMKSRTPLNINEIILFDMFGSPCWRVEILDESTECLNNYGVVAYVCKTRAV